MEDLEGWRFEGLKACEPPHLLLCLSSNLLLTDIAAWGDKLAGGDEHEASVLVLSAEDHALALNAFELAGCEVGDEADLHAHELFGLGIELGDTAHDGAGAHTILNLEL